MEQNKINSNCGKNHSTTPPQSPSGDFVSADINEVLRGARQILTGGKPLEEDPNNRVIDESTTVRVTKTGKIEGPLEVAVGRSRVISRPNDEYEDQGWSSDSDIFSRARLSSSAIMCAHHRKTSFGDFKDLCERHENVVYRKKGEELWRREEHMNGAEKNEPEIGESQIEVDFKEECHTEQGSHVVKQTWEVCWTVMEFHDLPDWLQDNEFLHTSHRPPTPNFAECFKSILAIHTETGNIWTHLIGCLFFLFLAIWFWTGASGEHIQLQDKMIFSFFLFGAIFCMGMSCVFHTVSCHSKQVVRIFSKLDYTGISLLIIGSFIPWIYYGFYCRLWPKISYITMIVTFGILAVFVSLNNQFNDKRYRSLRACIFSTMGLSGVLPTIHFIYTDGIFRLVNENSFYWLLAMAGLYLFGALLYATRTPERYFPGKCDVLFQSHQLFHVCVVAAATVHYWGISEMAWNRLTATCPGGGQISGRSFPHSEL